MLTPEHLDPDTMAPGVFMDVQTSTGAVLLTAIPSDTFRNACASCAFYEYDDCGDVRCSRVLWGTKETFTEYLEHKLLK